MDSSKPTYHLGEDPQAFKEAFNSWASCLKASAATPPRLIAYYIAGTDARCRRLLKSCQPGDNYIPFNLKGHDNLDGQPPPLLGDLVDEADVSWELVHRKLVQIMTERGILDSDRARITLKKLTQGSTDVETYGLVFRHFTSIAHPSAATEQFRAEFVDGLTPENLPALRANFPHVKPLKSRMLSMLKNSLLDNRSFDEILTITELEQADLRRELGLFPGVRYAPSDAGQAAVHPATGAVLETNHSPEALMMVPVNAVDVVGGNHTLAQTGMNASQGVALTLEAFLAHKLEMEAAQVRATNEMDLRVTSIAKETQQNTASVRELSITMSSLERMLSENAGQVGSLARTMETLVQQSINQQPAPSARPFNGTCFNCQKKGHISRNCPDKITQIAVNAVMFGGISEADFATQFGDLATFQKCPKQGNQDSASGALTPDDSLSPPTQANLEPARGHRATQMHVKGTVAKGHAVHHNELGELVILPDGHGAIPGDGDSRHELASLILHLRTILQARPHCNVSTSCLHALDSQQLTQDMLRLARGKLESGLDEDHSARAGLDDQLWVDPVADTSVSTHAATTHQASDILPHDWPLLVKNLNILTALEAQRLIMTVLRRVCVRARRAAGAWEHCRKRMLSFFRYRAQQAVSRGLRALCASLLPRLDDNLEDWVLLLRHSCFKLGLNVAHSWHLDSLSEASLHERHEAHQLLPFDKGSSLVTTFIRINWQGCRKRYAILYLRNPPSANLRRNPVFNNHPILQRRILDCIELWQGMQHDARHILLSHTELYGRMCRQATALLIATAVSHKQERRMQTWSVLQGWRHLFDRQKLCRAALMKANGAGWEQWLRIRQQRLATSIDQWSQHRRAALEQFEQGSEFPTKQGLLLPCCAVCWSQDIPHSSGNQKWCSQCMERFAPAVSTRQEEIDQPESSPCCAVCQSQEIPHSSGDQQWCTQCLERFTPPAKTDIEKPSQLKVKLLDGKPSRELLVVLMQQPLTAETSAEHVMQIIAEMQARQSSSDDEEEHTVVQYNRRMQRRQARVVLRSQLSLPEQTAQANERRDKWHAEKLLDDALHDPRRHQHEAPEPAAAEVTPGEDEEKDLTQAQAQEEMDEELKSRGGALQRVIQSSLRRSLQQMVTGWRQQLNRHEKQARQDTADMRETASSFCSILQGQLESRALRATVHALREASKTAMLTRVQATHHIAAHRMLVMLSLSNIRKLQLAHMILEAMVDRWNRACTRERPECVPWRLLRPTGTTQHDTKGAALSPLSEVFIPACTQKGSVHQQKRDGSAAGSALRDKKPVQRRLDEWRAHMSREREANEAQSQNRLENRALAHKRMPGIWALLSVHMRIKRVEMGEPGRSDSIEQSETRWFKAGSARQPRGEKGNADGKTSQNSLLYLMMILTCASNQANSDVTRVVAVLLAALSVMLPRLQPRLDLSSILATMALALWSLLFYFTAIVTVTTLHAIIVPSLCVAELAVMTGLPISCAILPGVGLVSSSILAALPSDSMSWASTLLSMDALWATKFDTSFTWSLVKGTVAVLTTGLDMVHTRSWRRRDSALKGTDVKLQWRWITENLALNLTVSSESQRWYLYTALSLTVMGIFCLLSTLSSHPKEKEMLRHMAPRIILPMLAPWCYRFMGTTNRFGIPVATIQNGRGANIPINTLQQAKFHAATIKVWLVDEQQWKDVLIDLGAATSIMKASTVFYGIKRSLSALGRPFQFVGANGMLLPGLLGKSPIRMQFDKKGPTVSHTVTVLDNEGMPDILGVDFFDRYNAVVSFATKTLTLTVDDQEISIPFTANGQGWEENDTVHINSVTADCSAAAVADAQLLLLPGYCSHMECSVKHESKMLHCSQSFVVDSALQAECRLQSDDDIESRLKPIVGIMRAIPRALVAPRWCEASGSSKVVLRIENRGTEPLRIEMGQKIASLTELNLHATSEDDIVSLEQIKEAGMTPLQMARLGRDGDILGKSDWRTGLSGKQIVSRVFQDQKEEMITWLKLPANKINFGDKMPHAEKRELSALAFAFRDCFSDSKKPGKMKGVQFDINFKAPFTQSFKERVRRCSPQERLAQIKETRSMLEAGVIRRSQSPWASNVVMVKKKDGAWRYCIDWRRLNGLIKKDAFPLPRIDDSLDRLQGAERFTTFDISQAFWCVPCNPDHQQYTAFNSPLGLMEFTRMGFGLCNSSAVFQRAMQAALGDLSHEMCLLYIDDGLIFSSVSDHLDVVSAVLKRLVASGCTLKVSKCSFGCESVEFLGHEVVAMKGICVRKAKVEAIARTKTPTTAAEVKTFLGMAGFFRRFIPNFSSICAPLRAVEKNMKSKSHAIGHLWRPAVEQRCFDAIKAALVNFTILSFPDFSKPFMILCDSSHRQMGAALVQLDDEGCPRPICFASASLDAAQRRYGISDKEGLCVVWSTRLWRHYLHGSKTLIVTDHSALTALTSKRDFPNLRLARYALDLSEFDLEIVHRPGKFHFLPDWLSRAELEDMGAEGILEKEIERLQQAHLDNEAGLLLNDLKALKKQTHCLSDEVLYGTDGLGTQENNFADSVIFARGRVQTDLETLMNRSNATELKTRRKLLFAHTLSDSEALQQELVNTVQEDLSLTSRLKGLEETPINEKEIMDDSLASRAMQIYEHVCPVSVNEDSDYDSEGSDEELDAGVKDKQGTTSKSRDEDDQPIKSRIQEAQLTDLFAVAMRSYLRSDHGSLPKDEILRLDVIRLCQNYVLDNEGWLYFLRQDNEKDAISRGVSNSLKLYVPTGLRGEVVTRLHAEAGHPGHIRTAQLTGLHYYWPNMYADTKRLLQYCVQCRAHAPRRTKSQMQGHLQANSAGEVWVMDVLRLEKTEEGHHIVLCAIDVFSRYAVVEKLTAATAKLVTRAFADRILTICKPSLVITDGGSEFKAVFRDSLRGMGIQQHVTTAHHSEGHGLIERFNRTFTRVLSHMLRNKVKTLWPDYTGAALVAYNCTPHSAHGLVPLQVFFDTVDRSILPTAAAGGGSAAVQGRESALEMVQAREAMQQTVRDKLASYQRAMDSSLKEQRRVVRHLDIGDTVLVFRESGSRLKDKWNDRFDGPFVVLASQGETKHMVQRIGSDDKAQWEHIDNLVSAPILPQAVEITEEGNVLHDGIDVPDGFTPVEATTSEAAPQKEPRQTDTVSKKKFVVERILGKDATQGKYLVKWQGFDLATWEPVDNLDCSKLIKHWEQLSGRDQRMQKKAYESTLVKSKIVIASITLPSISQVINTNRTVHFINKDLSKIAHGDMITSICEEVGIQPEQLLLTWASPDCRTYARANSSNISRGNEYRNHQLEHHPPKDTIDDKRLMAIQHDILIQSLLQSFSTCKEIDPLALFVMENPSASLRRRTFVKLFGRLLSLTCHLVHYCAYKALFKKPTDIWTNMDWQPKGTTGDGLCHRNCTEGALVQHQSGRTAYRHPLTISGSANRMPKGAFSKAKVPELLHQELLRAALRQRKLQTGSEERTFVLELFAGSTQLGSTAKELGLSYIAVDMTALSARCFQELHGPKATGQALPQASQARVRGKAGREYRLRMMPESFGWTHLYASREEISRWRPCRLLRAYQDASLMEFACGPSSVDPRRLRTFDVNLLDQLTRISQLQGASPRQQEDWQHASSLLNPQPSSNHKGDHPKICVRCGVKQSMLEFELLAGTGRTERQVVCKSCQHASSMGDAAVNCSASAPTSMTTLIACRSCTVSKFSTDFDFKKPLKMCPDAPLTRQRTCRRCLERRADLRPPPKRNLIAPVPGPKRYCAYSDKTRRDGCPAEDFPADETVNTCDTHTAIRRRKSSLRKDKICEENFSDSLQGLLGLSTVAPPPSLAAIEESAEGEDTNEDDEMVVLGATGLVEDSAAEGSEAE